MYEEEENDADGLEWNNVEYEDGVEEDDDDVSALLFVPETEDTARDARSFNVFQPEAIESKIPPPRCVRR